MKVLLTMVLAWLLVCAQSCTTVNRDKAGLQHIAGSPPTEATAEPPSPASEQAYQTDAAANGGMSLRAATPYSANGAPAQQNVNPGPFVIAGQSPAGAAGSMPLAGTLTRSADGTMSGPNDLPAATTGWGTAATDYGGSAAAVSKPAAKPAPK